MKQNKSQDKSKNSMFFDRSGPALRCARNLLELPDTKQQASPNGSQESSEILIMRPETK